MLIFIFLFIFVQNGVVANELEAEIDQEMETEECADKLPIEFCGVYKNYCGKSGYQIFLSEYCKKTCNKCDETYNKTSALNATAAEEHSFKCGQRHLRRWKRIVGGKDATLGAWPWQVNIEHRHNLETVGHYCGGSLINKRWILSAAHCFYHDDNPDNFWVRLGEVNLNSPGNHVQAVKVRRIILHQRYHNRTHDNDIALLKLNRDVTFNKYIFPICLPPPRHKGSGKNCHLTGWGNVKEHRSGPKILQQAKVKLIPRSRCVSKFRKYDVRLSKGMLCTGSTRKRRQKDSCYGDSGGPLVCTIHKNKGPWYLWGIISWGVGCGRKEFFGVHTNVKYYMNWITRELKN